VLSTTGDSLFDAAREVRNIAGRKPPWGHLRLFVYSEALVREGLGPVLDVDEAFSSLINTHYDVARIISIRGFFEHVKVMIFPLWTGAAFLAISVFYYCTSIGVAQIIGLNTPRHVAPSIRIAMTARPVLGFRHGPYMDEFVTRTLVWYALAVEACLTLLLLIVSTIRQRSDGSDR